MCDISGTLALIDRNFQGFGKEIFTDAGKYVIHFGESPIQAAETATKTLKARTNDPNLRAVTPMAKLRTGVKVIPSVTGNQLVLSCILPPRCIDPSLCHRSCRNGWN